MVNMLLETIFFHNPMTSSDQLMTSRGPIMISVGQLIASYVQIEPSLAFGKLMTSPALTDPFHKFLANLWHFVPRILPELIFFIYLSHFMVNAWHPILKILPEPIFFAYLWHSVVNLWHPVTSLWHSPVKILPQSDLTTLWHYAPQLG